MSDYSQPDFYRFNADSLKLVAFVKDQGLKPSRLLDLGAGSGIIGIELAQILNVAETHFVELQKEFLPHLEANIKTYLRVSQKFQIFHSSFADFDGHGGYDLIVSNPPYYLPHRGQPSSHPLRNIARSFVVDGWGSYLKCIKEALCPNGLAFIVIKNDKEILDEVKNEISDDLILTTHSLNDLVILKLALIEYKLK